GRRGTAGRTSSTMRSAQSTEAASLAGVRKELLLAAARTPEAQESEVRARAPDECIEELPETGVDRPVVFPEACCPRRCKGKEDRSSRPLTFKRGSRQRRIRAGGRSFPDSPLWSYFSTAWTWIFFS